MKSPALNRILEKSPPESLAALSVSAFLRNDNAEIERIFGALPSQGKASRHEFFIRHHAMTESVLLWSVEYWKTIATVRACLVALLSTGENADAKASSFLADAYNAKAASLIEAMRRICADNGLDFEDVVIFAEVDTDVDAKPIPKLVEEYVELFGVVG